MWPFVVLALSVCAIVLLITVARLHAFVALILAAIFVGILAAELPGVPEKSHWVQAVELTTAGFGVTAGKIAVVIALASIIGMCLMESGAADKVVRRFLAVFGEKRAGAAIMLSGYVLSIPIFFDTFFMLLLPLAQAMAYRTGRDYLLYVMAICCGSIVTHSLLIPHPGPLAMAEALKIDAGLTIVVGLVAGLVPVLITWQVVKWLSRRIPIPLRESGTTRLADLKAIVDKPESELPSFVASILPVIVPIFLISLASSVAAMKGFKASAPGWYALIEFLGNRNVALLIGTVMAAWVVMRQRAITLAALGRLLAPPLETAGVIILITSAGGAFGMMLSHAGVGEAVQAAAAGREVNLILLAWVVAAVIRVAQGSATVAMLTASAMVYPLLGAGLPYDAVYIFMSIGFGAMTLSWMNDSGFWVVCKLSGFTEQETLKTWTVLATTNSLVGLLTCLVMAKVLPRIPGF
ncbi:MAG: GntP family permease [Verrucomicrobia bacterium]|nr:GntP family permease [Verrucomicrobiota bacterium]